MGKGDTLPNAALGAALTVVASFTLFSPVLGGGLAGYLQRADRASAARVGALSGAIATVPFVAFLVVGLSVLAALGFGTAFSLVFLLALVPVAFVWNVGLGALGGYLGAYVREEQAERDGSAPAP